MTPVFHGEFRDGHLGKRLCVLSGNCLLSPVGIPTDLTDYRGEKLYSGDLVVVVSKRDYEISKEEGLSEEEYFSTLSLKDLNVVLAWNTETSIAFQGEPRSLVSYMESPWIFGYGIDTSKYDEYIILKAFDHSSLLENYSHKNFHYEKVELKH